MLIISYLVVLLGFFDGIALASEHSSAKNSSNSIVNPEYAPTTIECPAHEKSFLRKADGLSKDEQEWLEKRQALTSESLRQFFLNSWRNFSNANETVNQLFPLTNVSHHHKGSSKKDMHSLVPKIGIAASGGSYRAMFNGAGMLAALDNRTMGSMEHGLGGLLQGASYLVGSSGGAWLVGTLVGNNWTSVQSIIDNTTSNHSIWDITRSLGSMGSGNTSNATSMKFLATVKQEVEAKKAAGFPISLSDYLGHAMAYEFFPQLYHGASNYSVSDVRDMKVFQDAEMPFPLILAQHRATDGFNNPLGSTVFEFSPFEMGSWDETLNGFTDVKYLGTEVSNGVPVHKNSCVVGFDNYGFVLGTSASLISAGASTKLVSSPLSYFFNGTMNNKTNFEAVYAPNPFKNANFGLQNSTLTKDDALNLVDGGEDEQVIPFVPLLQKERDLDVIFALDNSAALNNWPDGASLVATYERQFGKMGKNIAFPPVPDVKTFEEQKLNQRITFFGCDDQELKNLSHVPPLIVYMPNAQHSFASNTSTYQISYGANERFEMIKNGFEAITMGNLTQDSNFRGCISCALAKRKQQSNNISLPRECEACFSKYCWSGAPAAPNVTTWNQTVEAKLGFGIKNVTSNLTLNATTWRPFGNGSVNLTSLVDTNSTMFESKKNEGKAKHNAASGSSVSKALALTSLFGLMTIIL